MYQGFIEEGVAGNLVFQLRTSAGAPVEPDAAPTFRIYGGSGFVTGGDGTAASLESGNINGATNASPIVISTTANHNLTTGQRVTVASVGGNTAANGTFTITVASATTFSLNGSTGNGAYTSGGTWRTTGLYRAAVAGAVLSALEAGKTYLMVLNYAESATAKVRESTFTVR